MNKYVGTAALITALLAQTFGQVLAQSADPVDPQATGLQPAMSPMPDVNLRPQIGGPAAVQSASPAPFTATSPYSYSDPPNNSYDNTQPAAMNPMSSPTPFSSPGGNSKKSAHARAKKAQKNNINHGFSPAGAVVGVPDRAVKSSLGLTDRTAKAGLGVTGKTTKEFFKAIF